MQHDTIYTIQKMKTKMSIWKRSLCINEMGLEESLRYELSEYENIDQNEITIRLNACKSKVNKEWVALGQGEPKQFYENSKQLSAG